MKKKQPRNDREFWRRWCRRLTRAEYPLFEDLHDSVINNAEVIFEGKATREDIRCLFLEQMSYALDTYEQQKQQMKIELFRNPNCKSWPPIVKATPKKRQRGKP